MELRDLGSHSLRTVPVEMSRKLAQALDARWVTQPVAQCHLERQRKGPFWGEDGGVCAFLPGKL